MKDILGYTRDYKEKELLSSDYAVLRLKDGDKTGLVQNCQATYQHNVQQRYESGSSTVLFVRGQPQGSMQVGRLVGTKGWFAGVDTGDAACGELGTITASLDGDGQCQITANQSSLKFDGAILQSLALTFGAGQLEITDSCQFLVASMYLS